MAQLDAPAAPAAGDVSVDLADQTVNASTAEALYPDDQENASQEDESPETPEGEEGEDQAVEPEAPAIDPPVSFNAEAKAKFALLPPDMQTIVAEQEAHRNRQVQDATTRAAEAQRSAQVEAAQGVAQSQQYFAQQIEAIASHYAPQAPDPSRFQDMQSYGQAQQAYNQAAAQHHELVQHATQLREQAEQHLNQSQQQALVQDARRVMVELPELGDQSQYSQLMDTLTPIARELGYGDDRISQAWPTDVLAMKRAAVWKDKAAKWDSLQARKMEGVRSAKALPKTSTPGAGAGAAKPAPVDVAKQLYPND